MDSLTLKRHNSFQNQDNRKVTHSWSSPKTNLVSTFLNLENKSFENVSFSQ